MQNSQLLNDMLFKRKNRAIAIVLGVKERECDPLLNDIASAKLRKVVLDQFNDFHDFCLDLLRSLDSSSDVVINEVYLETLDKVHEQLGRLEPMVASMLDESE